MKLFDDAEVDALWARATPTANAPSPGTLPPTRTRPGMVPPSLWELLARALLRQQGKTPLFPLGPVFVADEAAHDLARSGETLLRFLQPHLSGDWGTVAPDSVRLNDRALRQGDDRLFSQYPFDDDNLWVITEHDRSATTLLYPHEY